MKDDFSRGTGLNGHVDYNYLIPKLTYKKTWKKFPHDVFLCMTHNTFNIMKQATDMPETGF